MFNNRYRIVKRLNSDYDRYMLVLEKRVMFAWIYENLELLGSIDRGLPDESNVKMKIEQLLNIIRCKENIIDDSEISQWLSSKPIDIKVDKVKKKLTITGVDNNEQDQEAN